MAFGKAFKKKLKKNVKKVARTQGRIATTGGKIARVGGKIASTERLHLSPVPKVTRGLPRLGYEFHRILSEQA